MPRLLYSGYGVVDSKFHPGINARKSIARDNSGVRVTFYLELWNGMIREKRNGDALKFHAVKYAESISV